MVDKRQLLIQKFLYSIKISELLYLYLFYKEHFISTKKNKFRTLTLI